MQDDSKLIHQLDGLGMLYHLYRNKTVAATAEKLNLDEKTVGRQIDALQAQMGDRELFVRVGRSFEPTPYADFFYYHFAKPTVEGLLATRDQGEPTGEIKIGGTEFSHMYYIGPLVRLFAARHPRVRVRLVSGTRAELEVALATGRVEVAVLAVDTPDPRFRSHHALSLPIVFLSSARRRLPDVEAIWRECAGTERLVCPPMCEAASVFFERERVRRGIRWPMVTEASSTAAAACLAAHGDIAVAVGASKLVGTPGLTAHRLAGVPWVKICIMSRHDANVLALEFVQLMKGAAYELAPPGSEFAPDGPGAKACVVDLRIQPPSPGKPAAPAPPGPPGKAPIPAGR